MGYFDSIPHAELMKCVGRRVNDRRHVESDKAMADGARRRNGRARPAASDDAQQGQRSRRAARRPISPLLSNLYMRRFVLGWKVLGHEKRLDAHIVNYADDFVICCRGTAERAGAAMRDMMKRLRLTVNEDKTHICRLPEDAFDFLGYIIGRCYSPRTGRAYMGTRALEDEGPGAICQDQRFDIAPNLAGGCTGVGGAAQPSACRLGELFSLGPVGKADFSPWTLM